MAGIKPWTTNKRRFYGHTLHANTAVSPQPRKSLLARSGEKTVFTGSLELEFEQIVPGSNTAEVFRSLK